MMVEVLCEPSAMQVDKLDTVLNNPWKGEYLVFAERKKSQEKESHELESRVQCNAQFMLHTMQQQQQMTTTTTTTTN